MTPPPGEGVARSVAVASRSRRSPRPSLSAAAARTGSGARGAGPRPAGRRATPLDLEPLRHLLDQPAPEGAAQRAPRRAYSARMPPRCTSILPQ